MATEQATQAELQQQTESLEVRSKKIKIINQKGYDGAVVFLRELKELKKLAVEHHKPIIESAYQTHKIAKAAQNKIVKPLEAIEQVVKGVMGTFLHEQEQKQITAQREASEAARKQAEEEAEKQAELARREGATEEDVKAIKKESMEAVAPAPVVQPKIKQDSGVYQATTYSAEVINFKGLVKAVAAGKVPLSVIKPDMVVLNAQARSLQGTFKFPGVKLVVKHSTRVR